MAQSVKPSKYDGLSMDRKHLNQIAMHHGIYITLITLCNSPNGLGIILAVGRETQAHPWSLLASQSSLIIEF